MGENTDFGFVRDKDFRSYSIRSDKGEYSISRTDSSGNQLLFSMDLKKPGWSHLSGQNKLYFTDYPLLYAWGDDTVTTIAEDLTSSRIPFSIQSDEHHLYGIWTDSDQSVYLAVYGGRVVKKIDRSGLVSDILKSDFFWSPLNGVFDRQGNLWLMESSLKGEIRVRKIGPEELLENVSFLRENLLLAGIPIALILLIVYRIRKKRPVIQR